MKKITKEIHGIFISKDIYIYKKLSRSFDYKEDDDGSLKTAKESAVNWVSKISECLFLNLDKDSFAAFPGERVIVRRFSENKTIGCSISIDNAFVISPNSNSLLSYKQTISVLNEIINRGIDEYISHYKPLFINTLNTEIDFNKDIASTINTSISKETDLKKLEKLDNKLSNTHSDIRKSQYLLNAWNNIVQEQDDEEDISDAIDLLEDL